MKATRKTRQENDIFFSNNFGKQIQNHIQKCTPLNVKLKNSTTTVEELHEKTQEFEAVMSDKSDLIQTVLSRTRAQKCLS